MAYEGYLVKIGDYTVDSKRFIALKSYHFQKNYMDNGSKRNGKGGLYRTVVDNKPNTVSFTTPAMLTNKDVAEFFNAIKRNYINADEQKVSVTAYYPKYDTYETQLMYLAEPEFNLYLADSEYVMHDPFEVVFTGY